MKTLYFDCFAGASGNMILGALIGLGVDPAELQVGLDRSGIAGVSLRTSTVDRSGISSVHVDVDAPEQTKHRHLHHIEKLIDDSSLSASVKERARAIFKRLAAAEAKIHGIEIGKVHFHEVGALDAIADVVGACIGFERLGVERFVCSRVHVGSGFVTMAHGKYPVPPPAVAELLEGVPVYSTEIEGELITPTGAAIITTVCEEYGPLPEMSIERTGYGAGTREYVDFPNTLRLVLGDSTPTAAPRSSDQDTTEVLDVLEANIDDLSPQVLGYVLEQALAIGSLDAWFTPIQMKKDRPATKVSVLCRPADRSALLDMLYAETTTLGVRISQVDRVSLAREVVSVQTSFGPVDVKTARRLGSVVNAMPEYDQVKRIARENGIPFREVQAEVLKCFEQNAEKARSKGSAA